MYFLPDEILETILFNLYCKDIIQFKISNKKYNSLNLDLDKIKYKGFPRAEGKSKLYNLNDKQIDISDENNMLNYLFDNNIIYGDMIIYNCKYIGKILMRSCEIRIFDGIKLQKLNSSTVSFYKTSYHPARLPVNFRVIENNVPINYWNIFNNLSAMKLQPTELPVLPDYI